MKKVNLGKVRGTQIYTGDAITGTSSEAAIYPESGISEAYVGDLYINVHSTSSNRGNIYICTMSGDANNAEWSYQGNIRGPEVSVINNLKSASTTDALAAYQGKKIYDLLVASGIFTKHCVIGYDSKVYGVKVTIENISTELTLTVDGTDYFYTYTAYGNAETTTLSVTLGGSIGMPDIGGVLTEIKSSNSYIYAIELTDNSGVAVYAKNTELWDTVNEVLQTHEITGTITDGTEIIRTGLIYKFLKGIKTLFYPITHAKAVWYKKENNITVYDQIKRNTEDITGKAPTAHNASSATYGSGTGTRYGHVKLSDSISSSSSESSGIAATPKAVKQAYDLANDADKEALSKLPKSGGIMTGSVTFDETASGNGMIYLTNLAEVLEMFRTITGEDPTLLLNNGMYTKGIGSLNLGAGKIVRLLIKNERLILEESSDTTYSAYFRPYNDNKCALGNASKRFYGLWAGKSTIQTSDAREKENIIPLGLSPVMMLSLEETTEQIDIHSSLFDRLQPVQYNFIDGDERICYGLIAQDVAAAMEELGIGENELDLVHHEYYTDEDTGEEKESYGLAYNNLIALLIYEVQKLKAKVETLQAEVNSMKIE